MSKAQRDTELRATVSAEALLRRIFDIMHDEAARNPDLMLRLMTAIAEAGGIEPPVAPTKPTSRRKSAPNDAPSPDTADELAGFNPIAMLSSDGAAALRDHLRFVKRKEPLAKMAKRYALDVPSAVVKKKATVPAMIEAIIAASERRIREQELSGG